MTIDGRRGSMGASAALCVSLRVCSAAVQRYQTNPPAFAAGVRPVSNLMWAAAVKVETREFVFALMGETLTSWVPLCVSRHTCRENRERNKDWPEISSGWRASEI